MLFMFGRHGKMLVLFALIGFSFIAVFLLWKEGLLRSTASFALAALLIAAALLTRALMLPHKTYDYIDYLYKWVEYFRENGGLQALDAEIGNYNIPYLVILALFSYLDVSDLYLIKLLSIFFDIVLAYFAMRTVSLFTDSRAKSFAVFFTTLLLPAVVLNGAYWGQCDSIYAAFVLAAIFFALDKRPVLSVASAALAFSFKLQAVFFLPLYAVMLITGKLKIRHLLIFPAVYIAAVSPALIAGRSFFSTVALYFSQLDTVGSGLNYNSPSVFSFFSTVSDTALWSAVGISAALLLIAAACMFALFRRNRVTSLQLMQISLLFVIGIPFLLPHMHDRYFFMADILSVCYAFISRRRFSFPVLVSFASLLGYHAYLRMRYLLPMWYGASALVIVLLILIADLFFHTGTGGRKQEINC